MADIRKHFLRGDVVTLPSTRPSHWNKKGEMDKFLGKQVEITSTYTMGVGLQRLYFVGCESWMFLNTDIGYKPPYATALAFRPYTLPVDKIFKAVEAQMPPPAWKPEIGKLVHTFRPFKVYRDHGNGWFDICDDNGNCLTASTKELHKHFYETLNKDYIMKAMKDAVLKVARDLAKANNTVTTLEIKNELRRDYPYYYWDQQTVSDFMSQLSGDGIFNYTDNGTFRTYSLVQTQTKKALSVTKPAPNRGLVTQKKRRGRPSKTNVITQATALLYTSSSGFESVVINRKSGPIQYTKADIQAQKKSPFAYINRSLNNVTAITVGGTTFQVK